METFSTLGFEGSHTHSLPGGSTGTTDAHSHTIPNGTTDLGGAHSHTLNLTLPITPAQAQFEARATKGGFTTSEVTSLTIYHTP